MKRISMYPVLVGAAAFVGVLAIGFVPLYQACAELTRTMTDEPPLPRPDAARGALISARPFNDLAALPSAERNYLVLYNSRTPDDLDVVVSGTVAIPKGNPPVGGWPIVNWTHGTTGIAPQCAPSGDTADGPEHRYLSSTRAMLDSFVRRGYVVMATDYQGFGQLGTQAYLVGLGEGRSAIDIMRAARKVDLTIGTRYVVMGHSQGGQADLFTAAIGPNYAPEFTLLGNVAMAPASHMSTFMREAMHAPRPSPNLLFMAYMLQSYATYYPEIDLEKILTPLAVEHLQDSWEKCVDDTLSSGYWAQAIPSRQFLPEPDVGSLLRFVSANEPGTLRVSVPTLLVQGTDDRTVARSNTDALARDLCRLGSPVSYRTYVGATHEGLLSAAQRDITAWIDARFAGAEATSNCDAHLSPAAFPE